MATSTPALDLNVSGAPRVIWPAAALADTFVPWVVKDQYGLAGAVQFEATFAGTTVALHGSIDGVTYFLLKDLSGNNISATADALFEFTTSCPYLNVVATGGAATGIVVTMALRG